MRLLEKEKPNLNRKLAWIGSFWITEASYFWWKVFTTSTTGFEACRALYKGTPMIDTSWVFLDYRLSTEVATLGWWFIRWTGWYRESSIINIHLCFFAVQAEWSKSFKCLLQECPFHLWNSSSSFNQALCFTLQISGGGGPHRLEAEVVGQSFATRISTFSSMSPRWVMCMTAMEGELSFRKKVLRW